MRAWVKLRDMVTFEGFGTLVADVVWSDREPGCVWLTEVVGSVPGRDRRPLETKELVVPLSSIAWIVPADGEDGT